MRKVCAMVKGSIERYEEQMLACVTRIEEHEANLKKAHHKKKHIDTINAERKKLELIKERFRRLAREFRLSTESRYEDAKKGLPEETKKFIEENEVDIEGMGNFDFSEDA